MYSGDRQPPAVMARLWVAMTECYGNAWTSQFGFDATSGAALRWASALGPYSPEQIAAALETCRKIHLDWPPSLPRFVAYAAGIPTLAQVRSELTSAALPCGRFTLLVRQSLDTFRWRGSDTALADRLLSEAYERATEHVLGGGELPEPEKELAPPSDKVVRLRATAKFAAPYVKQINKCLAK